MCHCSAELNHDVRPHPVITWFREEQAITQTKNLTITYDEQRFTTTLDISDCFPENQGLYRVKAQNEAGVAESTAFLEVKCKYKIGVWLA